MATLVNKMNREVKVIIPNMREFRVFYSDNEGSTMFFKRDWEEEKTTKQEEQVWSEEDEACKQTILCAVQGKFVTDAALRQAILWLKCIPLNLKKKNEDIAKLCSNEWSEEDEGELQNAIDALEFLGKKGAYKSESGYDAALQAASWLKNITERFNLQPKEE